MNEKYFIVGYYNDFNKSSECFLPTSTRFENIQDCINWIENHRRHFSPMVSLGVFSVDNTFSF